MPAITKSLDKQVITTPKINVNGLPFIFRDPVQELIRVANHNQKVLELLIEAVRELQSL